MKVFYFFLLIILSGCSADLLRPPTFEADFLLYSPSTDDFSGGITLPTSFKIEKE
jgi:hypothetical protein